MTYSEAQILQLEAEFARVLGQLDVATTSLLADLHPRLTSPRAKEFVAHGVGRRLSVITHCLRSTFGVFPPEREELLTREERCTVEVNLHAFVMSVYGAFDNLAWVYVYEHALEGHIRGGRRGVGLFDARTQRHLPVDLCTYLTDPAVQAWYTTYAKQYRDALAHRIPLYVPPSALTADQQTAHTELTRRIDDAYARRDFATADHLSDERQKLGSIAAVFVHSYVDARPLVLHPQMLSDANTLTECVTRFVRHFWDARPAPA